MKNYDDVVFATCNAILPTYPELMFNVTKNDMPCISYQMIANTEQYSGNSQAYSYVTYRIKVWGKDIQAVHQYAIELDDAMAPTYLKRASTNQLLMGDTMCLIMDYSGLARETFSTWRN